MNRVKETNRNCDAKVHNDTIGHKMKIGTELIKKWPQRHQIIDELGVIELEILVCLLNTLFGFKGLTPVEQVAVFLRLH